MIGREEIDSEDHLGHRGVHEKVDRAFHLIVARSGVQRDARCIGAQRHADRDRATALAVTVESVGKLPASRAETLPKALPDRALALLDQGIETGIEHLGRIPAEQLEQALFAQTHRRHSCAVGET